MNHFRKMTLSAKFLAVLVGLFSLSLALMGCAQQSPTSAPPGTFVPQARDVATDAPPIWVEGAEEVTLANVSRISYIGRLDARGTPSTVFAYAYSPDNTRLAGLNNQLLIGWDLVSGQIVFNTARGDAQFVFYGADKTEIYTIDNTGLIAIYNADTGQSKTTLPGQADFNGIVAYYPDQGWLALGSINGTVKVWDVAARQSVVTIQAHKLQVTALAFSADGKQLATASDDQTVKIWDWQTRNNTAAVQATANKLTFAPDGKQIAAGENQKITLWSLPDGKLASTLTISPATTDIMTYSPDGQYLINAGSAGKDLLLWDTKTGKLVNTLPGVGGDSVSAAFSPNGDLLATSVLGGAVQVWDVNQIRTPDLPHANLPVNTKQILYTDWTGDGFLLTLIDATGPIQMWGIPPQPATATPPPG